MNTKRIFVMPLLVITLLAGSGLSIAADSHSSSASSRSTMDQSMMGGSMMGGHMKGGAMMQGCPMMGQLPPGNETRDADARRNDEGDGRHHAQVRRQGPNLTVEIATRPTDAKLPEF